MKILRLHVENFGTLHDFSMELTEGLNVLYRENGWGKSTLAVFIKAMLYGLPATSKRSLDENERKKYTPWQGGAYGGSLEFESAKGRFRAERFFGAKESADSFALYDLDTHLKSEVYSSALGVELFGIDADGYERTVYLSQRGVLSKGENYSITAKLGDLLDDVDDIGGFDSAAEVLDKRCKYYVTTGNRGRIAVLEAELAQQEREREALLRVRATLEERERELEALEGDARALLEKQTQLRAALRRAGEAKAQRALLNEQTRLQTELEALVSRRDQLAGELGGLHPTEETLKKARHAAMCLRELSARLREIPEEKAVTTEILPPSAWKASMDDEALRPLTVANDALKSLAGRLTALGERNGADTRFARFSKGVPSEEEMREGFAILDGSARQPQKSGGSLAMGALLVGGIGCVAFLCLFVLLNWNVACLAGLILSLCAVCAGAIGRRLVGKRRKEMEEKLSRLRRLLDRYGMNGDGELYREWTELSLLRTEYLKRRKERESLARECEALEREYRAQMLLVKRAFSDFEIVLPEKSDYTEEIKALQRDVALLRRARSEAKTLRERKRETSEEIGKHSKTLEALLPLIGCREGQEVLSAIDTVSRLETEYRLVDSEACERAAALEKFNAEHPALSAPVDVTPTDGMDYETLSSAESELARVLSENAEKQAQWKTQIERLSMEADRIPEVEASIFATREALAEAEENSATVTRTLKFLEEAKVGLSTRYLDGMQESLGQYLEQLRPDADDAVMDASFDVSLRAGGKIRDMEYFSRGWRDLVQFCTRLSLVDALYGEGERPCLVLDDPFVNLDDRRLDAARDLIGQLSCDYQIIYMVCHTGRE